MYNPYGRIYTYQTRQYLPVTAYTATRPVLVNGVDINTGLYPVLNFQPQGAQYPYIYVPIAEFSRVGARVVWDEQKQTMFVTTDYFERRERVRLLEEDNQRLRAELGMTSNINNHRANINGRGAKSLQNNLQYRPVTAYTATRPIIVNGVDINTGLYPVLNFQPQGAQYPYIYVPIAEFSRVGARVVWDEAQQLIRVTTDYYTLIERERILELENARLRAELGTTPITNRGNTSGNIINWGLVAEQNGWLYFSNLFDRGHLYTMRLDGTDPVKLSAEDVYSINVVGDWIYYISRSEVFGIFKIRTDGTGRTRIGTLAATEMVVVDNVIYYNTQSEQGRIYRMDTDGSNLARIGDDYTTRHLNVVDGWVYYTFGAEENKIYKIRIDGTDRTKITDDNSSEINVVGDWIYYSAAGDLYKIRTDGTQRTMLLDGSPVFINATPEWIYYGRNSLNKIRPDGTENTIVNSTHYDRLPNVIGDWIFFEGRFGNNIALYRVRSDGTGLEAISVRLT